MVPIEAAMISRTQIAPRGTEGARGAGGEAVAIGARRDPTTSGERRIRRASARRRAGLRVASALRRSDRPRDVELGEEMAACAERVLWAVRPCACAVPDRRIIGRMTCHNRLCGTCAAERARRLAAALQERVEAELAERPGTRAVFLTLTIRNTPEISAETISQLWAWFRQLRKRKEWRGVTGSGAGMEFTNRGRGWHPHLHALLTVAPGAWLPDQARWSEAWAEVTGGSVIVDIRPIRGDLSKACAEVAKYAAKAPELESDADILALHRAISGRRLWATTGILRGVEDAEDVPEFAPAEDVTGACPSCGVVAAPVFELWRWDWKRRRYSSSPAPPVVGVEGDRRALWGERADVLPPRPDPGDIGLYPPDPDRESAVARMVAKAFGPMTRNMAPAAPVGRFSAIPVEGKARDRYRARCACGWLTAGSFSTPGIALSFGAVAHSC